jgi:hypothetical protein
MGFGSAIDAARATAAGRYRRTSGFNRAVLARRQPGTARLVKVIHHGGQAMTCREYEYEVEGADLSTMRGFHAAMNAIARLERGSSPETREK